MDKIRNKDIIQWWESKRKYYNLLLLVCALMFIASEYKFHLDEGTHLDYSIGEQFLVLIFWMLGANVFYCLGAGVDLVNKYYGYTYSDGLRYFVLMMGMFTSIIFTALKWPN